MQETWGQYLGQEDPLEKVMAIHSSGLAWRTSMDRGAWQAIVHDYSRRVTHDWATNTSMSKKNKESKNCVINWKTRVVLVT